MTWEKVIRHQVSHKPRRQRPCTSRSPDRPESAYLMLPRDMAKADRVSIYTSRDGRIAFEFCADGDYAVRRTSRTSYTVKITIPRPLVASIPFGLTDVELDRNPDGWLILKA